MLEHIQNSKSLPEVVVTQLIKFIIDNQLKQGDKLPSEIEMAKQLGVSRSTIREAIKTLTSRNIVEIKRGCGTYVSQKMGVIDDPLGFEFIQDKEKLVLDVLEVRQMIEPNIAAMAAKMATKEEVIQIEKLCQEVEILIINGEKHAKKDIELHTQIAKTSKNVVVSRLIPIINESIEIFIEVTKSVLRQESIDTHRAIVEAIKMKDEKGAYDAMQTHILANKRVIEKWMIDNLYKKSFR